MIEPSTPYSLLHSLCNKSDRERPDAWTRFVHLYGPLVYRWIRRAGLQSSDAADVTQDVLISVSKNLAKFDPTRPGVKFRAWLWTITRRRMSDAIRHRNDEVLLGSSANALAEAAKSGEPPTDFATDRHTLLHRALAIYRDRFDPKTWQAFWATVVEGRQVDEVAQSLAVSR